MQANTHPYDPRISLRLDALIISLEQGPPAAQRLALRLAKRYFERAVPAYGRGR